MTNSVGPIAAAVLAAAVCLWVYADARRQVQDGHPVVARIGTVSIADPLVWLVGTVVLWIVFVPLYLVCRRG